jgi:hypothetical protein
MMLESGMKEGYQIIEIDNRGQRCPETNEH